MKRHHRWHVHVESLFIMRVAGHRVPLHCANPVTVYGRPGGDPAANMPCTKAIGGVSLTTAVQKQWTVDPPLCVGINLSEHRHQPLRGLLHRLLAGQSAAMRRWPSRLFLSRFYCRCCCRRWRLRGPGPGQRVLPTVSGAGPPPFPGWILECPTAAGCDERRWCPQEDQNARKGEKRAA